jgi:predicted nucleotidyltransferase
MHSHRSSLFEYPGGLRLRTCSAEDLIVFKSFAARGQDWVDLERILVREGSRLDWEYILLHLRPLTEIKEAPEILVQLERLRLRSAAE